MHPKKFTLKSNLNSLKAVAKQHPKKEVMNHLLDFINLHSLSVFDRFYVWLCVT